MAIKKIIFDDDSEEEFIPTFPDDYQEWNELRKSWHLNHQRSRWEQNKIFHHLATDLEDYAKDEYDLVEESDDLYDYDNEAIIAEAEKRGLHVKNLSLENENIINQDFLSRFLKIINRGNDIEISKILDQLEKQYHLV